MSVVLPICSHTCMWIFVLVHNINKMSKHCSKSVQKLFKSLQSPALNPACYHTALWAIDRLAARVNITLRGKFFLLFCELPLNPYCLTDCSKGLALISKSSCVFLAPEQNCGCSSITQLKNVFLCVIVNRCCKTLLADGDLDLVSCCVWLQTHLRHSVVSWEKPFPERNTEPFFLIKQSTQRWNVCVGITLSHLNAPSYPTNNVTASTSSQGNTGYPMF